MQHPLPRTFLSRLLRQDRLEALTPQHIRQDRGQATLEQFPSPIDRVWGLLE